MSESSIGRRTVRKPGYVATIVFDILFLYIVNHLLEWGVPFLTEDFNAVVGLINLSLFVGIVGNLLLLIYDGRWFRHLTNLAINGFSFIASYTLLVIFPFEFAGDPWPFVARLVIILALAGIVIGSIIEFLKLILNRD